MSHTPGLMHVAEGQRRFVRQVDAPRHAIARTTSTAQGEIDARRIAACWNALVDVPTEWLEQAAQLGIRDVTTGNLFSARLKLQVQRDELLAALQLAVKQNSHDMLMTGEELRICESAIAKATGEQS